MADIVLGTLNAKFVHASFGLRYLMANLGALEARARLLEFDINQRPADIAEALLAENPRIIGLGVYIWNVSQTTELATILKRLRPDITLVAGGPEVSYEVEAQTIAGVVDYIITGEADLAFAELCSQLLAGNIPSGKIVAAPLPDFSRLALPYRLYDERDVSHRIIYVEASRGCPFSCEFCLSSLDIPVRQAPLSKLLAELDRLLERGVRQFKFVDRTFNLHLGTSLRILEFCLARCRPGLFFHFELVPDRLPESLREVIARFPPGSLQFEVGIQTFNAEVGERIRRRQDYQKLKDNLSFLRRQTGVHLHADLIAGLPGESLESFARGFDQLVALGPQEIQVGILKRLRGTPIARHDAEWGMVYNPQPPYEILQNRLIDFPTMQRLKRFARYWDLVGNSGNFRETLPMIWGSGSPFDAFLRWSDWLYRAAKRTDSIALPRLMEFLFGFLTTQLGWEGHGVAEALSRDYQRAGRQDLPEFLRKLFPSLLPVRRTQSGERDLPKRQLRHLSLAAPAAPPTCAAKKAV